MRSACVVTFLASILLTAPVASAQTTDPISRDEVSLYVTVTNKRGEWVRGLTRENFNVREGKLDHKISSFGSNEMPVSVGIMIDTSGSASTYLEKIPEAVSYFTNGAGQETELFVMTFNITQTSLVEPTTDRHHVTKTLLALRATPKGNTALFDAIEAGLEKLSKGKHAKKALIVFGDAQDNASKLRFNQILQKVRRSNVLLYNVNIQDPRDGASAVVYESRSLINKLTGLTGGRAMYSDNDKELFEMSYRTGEELRYQYMIGFVPPATGSKPAEWRKLAVKLELAPGNKFGLGEIKIRAREGYYFDGRAVD